jgi:hypothetical protein
MDSTGGSRVLPAALVAMLFRSVGVLALLAVPIVSGLGTLVPTHPGERPDQQRPTVWDAGYSERYPGCVASALWPAGETPVAVVTRTAQGRVARVAVDDQRRPLAPLPAGARTIGACR